jgi:hypothetical protein
MIRVQTAVVPALLLSQQVTRIGDGIEIIVGFWNSCRLRLLYRVAVEIVRLFLVADGDVTNAVGCRRDGTGLRSSVSEDCMMIHAESRGRDQKWLGEKSVNLL